LPLLCVFLRCCYRSVAGAANGHIDLQE